jgi:hypothetical protein
LLEPNEAMIGIHRIDIGARDETVEIDWAGEVIGWYIDAGGLGRGFVWKPDCNEF